MSLSISGIKSEVAGRTGRSISEITDYMLREILVDLTLELDGYLIYATASTIAGQANYPVKSFPELFKNVDVVKWNNKTPLRRIATWKDYQALIAEETVSDRDEPEAFIIYDDVLYLHPTPANDGDTIHLWGSKVEFDEDDFDVPDYFEPAIVEGLCNVLYSAKGLGYLPKAQDHANKYQRFKNQLAVLGQHKASNGSGQPDVI